MTAVPLDTAQLEAFLAERGEPLLRSAALLTGSQEAGEDLLQAALERFLKHRHDISDPEGYLRRTIYNLAADGWRRQRAWRTRLPLLRQQETAYQADRTDIVDQRDELIWLLLQLPPRQRAVLVLRYWEQLPESEVAELLGCSVGTVKSTASRGLTRLRELSSKKTLIGEQS
jgi:RNA polymerase sigma-70 factor (sigma-E family)